MAVDPTESDAAGRLTKMGRKGVDEKRRPIMCPVLFFFFAFFVCLAVNSFAQDLDSLARSIQHGTSEQKRDALYEIKKIANEPASRVAIAALSDGDVMVRATAASAVIYLPESESAQVLLPLLNDKQEFVRREAAYALGELGSSQATQALIGLVRTDKIVEVRDAAAVALGKIGDSAALAQLISILKKKPADDQEFLRRSAARSVGQIARLAQFGKTQSVTPQNFLAAKYKEEVSSNFGDLTSRNETSKDFRSALDVLIRVLDSITESVDTRREAAFAIGMIGNGSAIPVLTKYQNDSDIYLAETCKEALVKLSPHK